MLNGKNIKSIIILYCFNINVFGGAVGRWLGLGGGVELGGWGWG